MTDIKSALLDIVSHTAGLGIIENIKVTGSKKSTHLAAMDLERTVILNAELHTHLDEFEGEFGMGNLNLLNNLTRFSNYQGDDATIAIDRQERNGVDVPTTISFKDTNGNKDQYRFMSKEIVDQAMRVATFKGATWNIEIEPSLKSINQLSEVASVYAGIEPAFTVKTEENNLVFEVGSNEGGILGRRIFAENIDGTLSMQWSWPLATFLSILKLGGTTKVKFSDQGACQIDIDSGIANYTYILPALSR